MSETEKNEKTEKDMETMDVEKSGVFDKLKSVAIGAGKKVKRYAKPFAIGAVIGTAAVVGFSLLSNIAESSDAADEDCDDTEDFEESEDIMEDEVESSDEDAE